MNRREKLKNIFSWISLVSSILSFLFMFVIFWVLFPLLRVFLWGVSIIAISSGIYGIWGKGDIYMMMRSCLGLIFGQLSYVVWCASMIFVYSNNIADFIFSRL